MNEDMRRVDASPVPGTTLGRAVDGMNAAIRIVIAALLAGMCALALLQVVVRFVLDALGINLSVPWSEELARYFMIWLIFLGAAYGCRRGQLISLTLVVDNVPPKVRRIAGVLSALVCVAFYLLLVQVGLVAIRAGLVEMSPVLQFPKACVYAAMPIGAAAMAINTLALIAEGFGWIGAPAAHGKPGVGSEPGDAQ